MEKVYNVVDTAELLGVKARTIRSWIHNGTIAARKLAGTRRWIIDEAEIERMRNGHDHTNTEYSERVEERS